MAKKVNILWIVLGANLIALLLFNFLPFNVGAIRFVALALLFIPFFFGSYKKDNVWWYLLFFNIVILISATQLYFATEYIDNKVGKVILSSMGWGLGTILVYNTISFNKFIRIFYLFSWLIIAFLIISNIFGFGETSVYSDDIGVFFGGGGVNITKYIVFYIVALFPLIFFDNIRAHFKIKKSILYLLVLISLFFVTLAFKRGAMLGFVLSFLFFIWQVRSQLRYSKLVFRLIIVLIPLYFIVGDNVNILVESRLAQTEASLDDSGTDARRIEAENTISTLANGPKRNMIFGYGIFSEQNFYDTPRMIHTDYFSILFGMGIFGLSFYLFIIYIIYFSIRKRYNRSAKNQLDRVFFATANSILVLWMVIAISGFYHGIDIRLMSLIYLAGIKQSFSIKNY